MQSMSAIPRPDRALRLKVIAGALLGALALPSPAPAQLLVGGADAAIIASIARRHGEARLTRDVINWPTITVTNDQGRRYEIDFKNCDDGDACTSLWLMANFPDATLTLERINAFNRDYLYGRAYLDPDGAAVLQMDVSISPAVPEDWIDGQLGIWDQLLNLFAELTLEQ
jgi:hypothetical protein